VCFAKHTLNKHNLGPAGPKAQIRPTNYLCTVFLQQLHRNREKKKTLPGEAEGWSEGNSAGTDWRMLCSFSFQSLLPLFLVFVLFSLVMASSWGVFVFVSLYGFLLSSLLLSFASLMSVFIVSASLRVWETKFQSNSFSFLKFEFD